MSHFCRQNPKLTQMGKKKRGRKKKTLDPQKIGTINTAAGDPPPPTMTGADVDSIIVCFDDPLSPSPAMTPAGGPILICSLPESGQLQSEPDPGLGLGSTIPAPPRYEIKQSIHPAPKRSTVSRRKLRGVHLGPSDSDEDKQQLETLSGNRNRPPTIPEPTNKENQKDSTAKVGSCTVSPPPVKDSNKKSEKYCNASSSIKIGSCSVNPPSIANLLDVYNSLPQEHMKRIGEMDILEIAALKGFRFDPPRWHRPGGYDAKPKNSK